MCPTAAAAATTSGCSTATAATAAVSGLLLHQLVQLVWQSFCSDLRTDARIVEELLRQPNNRRIWVAEELLDGDVPAAVVGAFIGHVVRSPAQVPQSGPGPPARDSHRVCTVALN